MTTCFDAPGISKFTKDLSSRKIQFFDRIKDAVTRITLYQFYDNRV